jgi:DNA-binding NtrC family response regulator
MKTKALSIQDFVLIAHSGATHGVVWHLQDSPLLAGRGNECDIFINDPLVSRKHCRLEVCEGMLYLHDLGSRNTTLVNGRPTQRCQLRPGDEIGIGSARFLVANESPSAARTQLEDEPTTTIRLHEKNDALFRTGRETSPERGPAQTVEQLADYLALCQDLWSVQTVDDVVARLEVWLKRLLNPAFIWIGLQGRAAEGFGIEMMRGEATRAQQQKAAAGLARTMVSQEGFIEYVTGSVARQDTASVMAVPLVVGKTPIGSVAVVSQTCQTYSPDELHHLMVMANMAAPWFHSIDRIDALHKENDRLRQSQNAGETLVGVSRVMTRLRSALRRAADSDLNVLILGETGVGKELAARMLWLQSPHYNGAFVPINCAAIPRDLFESELFGYEKGAFTGADQSRKGLIELAHGGTLFLDEIGELSPENQARLLRVIERHSFRRVGGHDEVVVDFRLVAATNLKLAEAVEQGTFRRDLYYRLNSVQLEIPPLRERPSDIPVLAQHFFEAARLHAKRPVRGLSPQALESLRKRQWPGNVRELRAVIERAVALAETEYIQPEHLAADWSEMNQGPLATLAEVERRHIETVMQACGGRISEAARVLGIGRTTLYDKIARGELANGEEL